jgi:hypothetical protein
VAACKITVAAAILTGITCTKIVDSYNNAQKVAWQITFGYISHSPQYTVGKVVPGD